jgi:hypothetical protein
MRSGCDPIWLYDGSFGSLYKSYWNLIESHRNRMDLVYLWLGSIRPGCDPIGFYNGLCGVLSKSDRNLIGSHRNRIDRLWLLIGPDAIRRREILTSLSGYDLARPDTDAYIRNGSHLRPVSGPSPARLRPVSGPSPARLRPVSGTLFSFIEISFEAWQIDIGIAEPRAE